MLPVVYGKYFSASIFCANPNEDNITMIKNIFIPITPLLNINDLAGNI
jgi:hypothetical protein